MSKFKHLKPPYSATKVSFGTSQAQINEMMKEFGAKALRWTETPDSMKGKGMPTLEFILQVELEGVQKQFGIRVQAPLMMDRRKQQGRYGSIVNTPNLNASMRMLYWYLKARLEATLIGIEDVTETFMSKIIMQLPEGGTTTMGQVMKERPQLISELLPSFEIKQKQLPMHESETIETSTA